ncbi:hypothetical protein PPYR_12000 [Photinus pyralis]|uniref:LRRCT domain-containing protein n=1 Tax=Photinus pyralis TaxID=7054 RepID=A0A5N4ACX9_PHOPY|nr:leucine-rich repeat-containing protein 15-like [Photinus pyralis]KAB0795161.1 hypothetical protein PPYR_12000 [Photinus pyralis]
MAAVFLGLLSGFSSTLIWQDPVNYYCGDKSFSETPVSVTKSSKFVIDVSAEPLQNISLLLEPSSFIIDVTGCLTPKGVLRPAVGIEISNQKLPILYSGAVQNMVVLQMIKIEHCQVQDIHPGAFMILPYINTIFLRNNLLVYIKTGIFNNLRVAQLYLNNNNISYIENTALDDMPNLRLLNLDNNQLKHWNNDWFTNTYNLEHLSIDSNQLTKLPANAFNKLKNGRSTVIRLSNNQIMYIHPQAFRKLSLLHALWLNDNNLTDFDGTILSSFERLFVLSLSGNKLSCLDVSALYDLKSPQIVLHVENNEPMSCECLKKLEIWAKIRKHFLTQRYTKNECVKKKMEV